ncbi:glycosyl transferase [Anaerocolumna cellulosilytica]|uniref:Glycosyl transferase n=1 Tax=Anaerocolumna cellulosilytica TaxID=433286 RepID=A0A6S6R6Q3_9FIRM|nr:glycosyltransferase family 4 protein [Anaerocolumna cellulosilytica]MBB5194106.1 glycosyltransferase involved in cell wall biosynthesis [Anaerocolumna cellulosilytica]BCJ94678.1 glycosyl transferase [Anaerocolumna cellulosilytica]
MRIIVSASYGHSLINFRGELIKAMVKQGHEVICTSIEPVEIMAKQVEQLGAKYYQIPGSRTGIGLLENIRTFFRYLIAYYLLKPDLCFLYMSKPIVFGGICGILTRVKRIVVFVTGLEVAFYSPGIKNRLTRLFLKTMYRLVHSKSETVFFMNQDDYKLMLKYHMVRREQARFVNGSGVNMEYFTKEKLPEDRVVCMTARLVWSKGIREYLEAAEKIKLCYPDVRFLLVGGLDENPEAIKKEELDEVISLGIIEYYGYTEDVRPYLKQCSIFVLPSYHEGNGRSIVEAMATGRPIITTHAPGCKETVIDGYNGFLIPVRDSKTLTDKLSVLIEHSSLRTKMAESSYLLCKEKYDVNQVNEIFLKTLRL